MSNDDVNGLKATPPTEIISDEATPSTPVFYQGARSVERAIRRLLAEAPAPIPGQTPAIECGVMFAGGGALEGVLSETPYGGLRMMSPNRDQQAGRTARGDVPMVEQFFSYDDVIVVAIRRTITRITG